MTHADVVLQRKGVSSACRNLRPDNSLPSSAWLFGSIFEAELREKAFPSGAWELGLDYVRVQLCGVAVGDLAAAHMSHRCVVAGFGLVADWFWRCDEFAIRACKTDSVRSTAAP